MNEFAVKRDPERIEIIVETIIGVLSFYPTSAAWFLSAFLLLFINVEEHFISSFDSFELTKPTWRDNFVLLSLSHILNFPFFLSYSNRDARFAHSFSPLSL